MEERRKQIDLVVENVEQYAKTSFELAKLTVVDKVADSASSAIAWLAVGVALILFFITLNFGIAFLIGELLGKLYLGFIIVGSFYGLIALILFLVKDKLIKRPLNNSLINQMLK